MSLALPSNSPFAWHYYLKDALQARNPFQRVWSKNRRRADGTVGYKFVCATKGQFINQVLNSCPRDEWWWYEVIQEDCPASLYFDFEIEVYDVPGDRLVDCRRRLDYVNVDQDTGDIIVQRYVSVVKQPWKEEECRYVHKYIKYVLQKFLKQQCLPEDMIVLNGSRTQKMSLHILCGSVVLDRNFLSMRYLAWEFSRYLWVCVNTTLLHLLGKRGEWGLPPGFLRLLLLHRQCDKNGWFGVNDTGVDEAVYTRNRCFRILGSSKMGSDVPLCVVPSGRCPTFTFLGVGHRDMSCLLDTLIVRGEEGRMEPLVYRCSEECPHLQYFEKHFEKVHNESRDSFPFNRVKMPYFELRDGHRLFAKRRHGKEAHRDRAGKRQRRDRVYGDVFRGDQGYEGHTYENQVSPTGVYDDDQPFFGVDLVVRKVKEYCVGDNLFHDCVEECGVGEGEEGPPLPLGVPSAFILQGDREGSKLLKCHACGGSYFILDTHYSPRYNFPRVVTAPWPAKMPDLNPIMVANRMCVLDSPCGTGKTYQIKRCLSAMRRFAETDEHGLPNLNVLCCVYRKGLALTLGGEFELAPYTKINPKCAGHIQKWRRVSLCLNSIVRVPLDMLDTYDVVVLDECGFLRRHFITEHMSGRMKECYERLSRV
jgi:hypothetical protein